MMEQRIPIKTLDRIFATIYFAQGFFGVCKSLFNTVYWSLRYYKELPFTNHLDDIEMVKFLRDKRGWFIFSYLTDNHIEQLEQTKLLKEKLGI